MRFDGVMGGLWCRPTRRQLIHSIDPRLKTTGYIYTRILRVLTKLQTN